MSTTTITRPLLHAVYDRLQAIEEDVYLRGAADPAADPPYVLVELPHTERRNTLDAHGTITRLDVRCHTRYPASKANRFEALELAERVHEHLSGLTLNNHYLLHLPDPEQTSQSYEAHGEQAHDIILRYDLRTGTL